MRSFTIISVKQKIALLIRILFGVLLVLLFQVDPAHATQQHADPEGLYSHLIAHIIFIITMIVLVVQIYKSRPHKQRGWTHIGIAALLFLFWNIDTFTVHIITESLAKEVIDKSGGLWSSSIDISTFNAKIYYFGKIFDHVFLGSSVFVFFRGLVAFQNDIESRESQ